MNVEHYVTDDGTDVFAEWADDLRDRQAIARIALRIERLRCGSFGDCKALGEGVNELKIDYGPGYRVYYAMSGKTCILLLCGGDKRKQAADISKAIAYWNDYKRRSPKP